MQLNNVPFRDVCSQLEAVAAHRAVDGKKELMNKYISYLRSQYEDLYPLMRLILSEADLRKAYGFKHNLLAKAYVKFLGLAPDGEDATTLLDWKKPVFDPLSVQKPTDFSDILFEILRKRSVTTNTTSPLTIRDVNEQLDHLKQDKNVIQDVLQYFFEKGTALEQKWIVRMTLGELRLGIGESTIMTIYHPDAVHRYATCRDLQRLCQDLRDPNERVENMEIMYFSPCVPMHLKRVLPAEVISCIKTRPFWIERKLDGTRMFIHLRENEYRYFSRHGVDYTEAFGMNKSDLFSNRIHPLLMVKPRVKSMILDGEMMVYDPIEDNYAPFGALQTVINSDMSDVQHQRRPCCMLLFPKMLSLFPVLIFDLLAVNETIITNQPLKERRKFLNEIVRQERGTLEIMNAVEGNVVSDVYTELEKVMLTKGEGICIKDPESLYIPNERANHWLKIKPDFISELGEHMDVVIVGATYSSRNGLRNLGSFLCAVRSNEDKGKWLAFCRVGTGFSMQTLHEIQERLLPHCVRVSQMENVPEWLIVSASNREKVDVVIEPKLSIVVELKATEFIPTTAFPTGSTLRFPRFVKVRDDKSYLDALDVEGLTKLKQDSNNNIITLLRNDGQAVPRRIHRTTVPMSKKILHRLPKHMIAADLKDVNAIADIFKGLRIWVMSGGAKIGTNDKQSLEILIKKHGGEIVQCVDDASMAVSFKKSIKTKAIEGRLDVLKVEWILDCIAKQTRIPFDRKYMWCMTEETKREVGIRSDEFGDSFTEYIVPQELKTLFDSVGAPCIKVPFEGMAEMETRYGLYPSSRFSFMRPCKVMLNTDSKIETEIQTSLLEFFGAKIVRSKSEQPTHIVSQKTNTEEWSGVRMVKPEWIYECIKQKSLLDESAFSV